MSGWFFSLAIVVMWSLGFMTGYSYVLDDVKNNEVSGYHYAPIVKVKTLEEAKAIVEAHQKRIRSTK